MKSHILLSFCFSIFSSLFLASGFEMSQMDREMLEMKQSLNKIQEDMRKLQDNFDRRISRLESEVLMFTSIPPTFPTTQTSGAPTWDTTFTTSTGQPAWETTFQTSPRPSTTASPSPGLEDRVAKLEQLARVSTLRSCQEYSRYGLDASGTYLIDPDGPLTGHSPFQVYCNFTSGLIIIFRAIFA